MSSSSSFNGPETTTTSKDPTENEIEIETPQHQFRANLLDTDGTAEEAATQIFESAITDVDDENDGEDVKWLREQRMHHKATIWYKRPTVTMIAAAMLLYFTASAVAISARVVLMLDLACRHVGEIEDLTTCHSAKVQEVVSSIQSMMIFTTGLFSSLVSGKVGEISDRYGRKPVLTTLAFFNLMSKFYTLLLFQPSFPFHKYNFVLLAILETIGGGTTLILSVASSYVTDVVESHERIVSLGFVFGSLYTGLAIGPLIGSVFIKQVGSNFSVLYLETFLGFMFFVIVAFVLQESRSAKFRERSQSMHLQRKASFASLASERSNYSSKINNIIPFWRIIDICSPLKSLWIPRHKKHGLKPRINVLILIFIDCTLMITALSLMTPLILYTTYVYDWTSEIIGYYVSILGFSKTFVVYGFIPVFLHFLKKIFKADSKGVDYIDFTVIIFGAFNELLNPLLIILSNSSIAVFGAAVFGSLGAVAMPTLQASIVKYVPESKVGEVFGALSLLKSLLVMAGPPGFLFVYSNTVDIEPKIVFYVAVILIASGMGAAFLLDTKTAAREALFADSEQSEEGPLVRRRFTYGSVQSPRRDRSFT